MALKPRFMPKTPGANPWEPTGVRGVPIAAALTFSSKSPFRHDDWERSVARPYQIVAMPGYKPQPWTPALRVDTDYAWFDRPVDKPTIIWDGFCPVALWEVIYEAFREDPMAPRLRVRDAVRKTWVSDARSVALLSRRPVREKGGADPVNDPYGCALALRQRRKLLVGWAMECSTADDGGYMAQANWRLMATMYRAVLAPATEWHVDGGQRSVMAEAKWNRNHLLPIVEDSGYKSPVRFVDVDISREAHKAFAREAVSQEAAAAARRREFPAQARIEAPKDSLWGRFFGK